MLNQLFSLYPPPPNLLFLFAFFCLFYSDNQETPKASECTHIHATTAVSWYILKIVPWVALLHISGLFIVFLESIKISFNFFFSLFLIQLHCKDVFLLLALSFHKTTWLSMTSALRLLSQAKQPSSHRWARFMSCSQVWECVCSSSNKPYLNIEDNFPSCSLDF